MSSDRTRRAAAVGVVLIVAAAVVWIQFGQIARQSAEPTLPADAPPEGVAVFYTREAGNPHGLTAYDWTGKRRGAVRFPTWVEIGRLIPAPDGSGFALDPSSPGDYAAYIDRGGRVLYESDDPSFSSQAWADDSKHVCVLADANSGAMLLTRLPGQGDKKAQTRLAAGYGVIACSVRSDTVVLASSDDLEVMSLSTGNRLRGLAVGASPVASTDASYIALAPAGGAFSIYRSSDLTPVGRLDQSLTPVAFSGDNSLLLATTGEGGEIVAVDWRRGKTAWTYDPLGATVALVAPRPHAADFVVYFSSGPVLLRRDGKVGSFG